MTRHLHSGRRMDGDSPSRRFIPVSRFAVRLFLPASPGAAAILDKTCACSGGRKAGKAPLFSASLPSSCRDATETRGLARPPGCLGCAALRCVTLHTDSSHPPSDSCSPDREGRKARDARNGHLHRPPRATRAPRPCLTCPYCRIAHLQAPLH